MTPSSLPLFDQPITAAPSQPRCFPVAETVALYGPESLSDAQIIEAMLNRVRPGRAEEILHQVESLGRLVALGPAELQALGLTKGEMARFAVLQEVQRRSTRSFERPRISSPRAAGPKFQMNPANPPYSRAIYRGNEVRIF
jgi:DNA repair protein RadC